MVQSPFFLLVLIYLHFDPAVHRLEDLRVVDGMDLDQQGETLGHCGRGGASERRPMRFKDAEEAVTWVETVRRAGVLRQADG